MTPDGGEKTDSVGVPGQSHPCGVALWEEDTTRRAAVPGGSCDNPKAARGTMLDRGWGPHLRPRVGQPCHSLPVLLKFFFKQDLG